MLCSSACTVILEDRVENAAIHPEQMVQRVEIPDVELVVKRAAATHTDQIHQEKQRDRVTHIRFFQVRIIRWLGEHEKPFQYVPESTIFPKRRN